MSAENPEISLLSPADYVGYYVPSNPLRVDNDDDDGDAANARSYSSSSGIGLTNSTPSMSLTGMTSRSESMFRQVPNTTITVTTNDNSRYNQSNHNDNDHSNDEPSVISQQGGGVNLFGITMDDDVGARISTMKFDEEELYNREQQHKGTETINSNLKEEEFFDNISTRNQHHGECNTTAQELERILSPMKERDALLHASRMKYIEDNDDHLRVRSPKSSSFISGEMLVDDSRIDDSTHHNNHQQVKYDDDDKKQWISEKDEENIRSVVKSIEMQMHIKDLHQKEMDLMRLTGAEMEDMVQHQSDYQYAEYIKALLAARNAEDEEEQQLRKFTSSGMSNSNNSNHSEQQQQERNSSTSAQAFLNMYQQNNGGFSQSTLQILGENNNNSNQTSVLNPSVLTLKDTVLMRSAENRKRPRLFDIVAKRPPPMKDVPGMRNYLIMDELPPDPELDENNNNNNNIDEVARGGGRVGDNESQIQNKLLMTTAKSKEAVESQKRRELNAVRVFASEYSALDADGPLSATSTGIRQNSAASSSERHLVPVNETQQQQQQQQGKESSPATKTMLVSARSVLRSDDKEEKTVAERQNEKLHALIASSDSAAQIRHDQLKPISGVLTTFQAASPQLFDIGRHTVHRNVFSGAMQNWREKKAGEEHQRQLAGAEKKVTTLDQYSPMRILQRKGVFTNRSPLPAIVNEENNNDTRKPVQTLEVDERPPPPNSSDLRALLAEQQKLIRKAEKDDVDRYRPMVKNFLAYNEMMAEKMWSSLGGK